MFRSLKSLDEFYYLSSCCNNLNSRCANKPGENKRVLSAIEQISRLNTFRIHHSMCTFCLEFTLLPMCEALNYSEYLSFLPPPELISLNSYCCL